MIPHVTRRRLRAEEQPSKVDVENAVPVLLRRVHRRSAGRDPGVVGQDVEPAHITGGAFEHTRYLGRPRHIEPVAVRLSARRPYLVTDGVNL